MSAVFFAVDREHAKPMFAAREPAALLEFFHEFVPTDPPQLVMKDHWTVINEFLQQQGTSHEQWTMPLSMAFNGGRPLLDEPERKIYLVRPDVVGFLGEILKELLDEGTPEDSWFSKDSLKCRIFINRPHRDANVSFSQSEFSEIIN